MSPCRTPIRSRLRACRDSTGVTLVGAALACFVAIGTASLLSATVSAQEAAPAAESEARATPDVAALAKDLESADLQVRRDAVQELALLGEQALPALPGLLKVLTDQDPQVNLGALQAIAGLGPAAESALPNILEQLRVGDDQQRYRAAFALARIAQPRPEVVAEALRHTDPKTRAGGTLAVGWMDPSGHALLPELAARLGDDDASVRSAAFESFRQLGDRGVDALRPELSNERSAARQQAAQLLGELGTAAASALPALGERISDQDAAVRAAVVRALASIAPDDGPTRSTVLASLQDPEAPVRVAALESLLTLPETSVAALPELVRLLDGPPDEGRLALQNLVELGPKALPVLTQLLPRVAASRNATLESAIVRMGADAIPLIVESVASGTLMPADAARVASEYGPSSRGAFVELTKHSQPRCRAMACLVLGTLPAHADNVQAVMPFLADESPEVRRAAAEAIGQQGAAATDARPALAALLKDSDADLRAAVLSSLVRLGGTPEQIMEPILIGLGDASQNVRIQAMQGLKALEPLPSTAVENLLRMLEDADPSIRAASAETLGRGKSWAASAIPPLTRHLQDAEERVRLQSALALAQLGELPAETIQSLVETSRVENQPLRIAAVEALRPTGPQAKHALERLLELTHDNDPQVRRAVYQTIAVVQDDRAQAIGQVRPGLDDGEWTVRREVARILGSWGSDSIPAVPRLLQLMTSDVDADAATEAIRKIDAAPAEALPLIMQILEDQQSDRRRRFYALHLLKKLGPQAKEQLPALRRILEASGERNRELLERAIRDIEAIEVPPAPAPTPPPAP